MSGFEIPAIMAAAALFKASEAQEAGAAQRTESKSEAAAERLGATQREGDRKERLLQAISSRNAMAGASGITLEGSPFAQIQGDIKREETATERDVFQSNLKAMNALTRGKIAKRAANAKASAGLIESGAQIVAGSPKLSKAFGTSE